MPEDAEIQPRSMVILGTGGAKTRTLETLIMKFRGINVLLNISPENCEFIGDGVLGADLLFSSNVTIFGRDEILRVASFEIPFIQNLLSDETYEDSIRNLDEEDRNSGVNFIEYGEEIADAQESTEGLYDINYMDFKRIEMDMKMQADQIKIYNVNSCYRGAVPGQLDERMYNYEILKEFYRTEAIMDHAIWTNIR